MSATTLGSLEDSVVASAAVGSTADIPGVRVCVRLRPLLAAEQACGHASSQLQVVPGVGGTIALIPRDEPAREWEQGSAGGCTRTSAQRVFQFDGVAGPDSTNADVWEQANIGALVGKVVSGFNAVVFAYGMTGSGKTHTMDGLPRAFPPGVSPASEQLAVIPCSARAFCASSPSAGH